MSTHVYSVLFIASLAVFNGYQVQAQSDQNTFLGYQAGYSSPSSANTFIGFQTGYYTTTGTSNFMGGNQAGYSNTSGKFNVFLGPQAGVNNSTGNYNMFLGNVAGGLNVGGSYNMAIGDGAGFNNNADANTYVGVHAGFDNHTGTSNVFIGYQANSGGATALSNAIAIGANATVSASNALVLGNGVNVGIGTSAPQNKLEITSSAGNSGLRFTNLTSATTPSVSTNQFLTVNANGDVVLALVGAGKGSFRAGATADSSSQWNSDGLNLRNANTGGVVIGPGISNTPAGYRLYVADGILTEKVKVAVKTTNDWSDKVFETGYDLKELVQVEAYIKANKHLPGVSSAEEVVKQGLDVAKMDAKLLEKIEELTLYSIQLEKANQEQQRKLETMKRQQQNTNQRQQAEIDELKRTVRQLLDKK